VDLQIAATQLAVDRKISKGSAPQVAFSIEEEEAVRYVHL